MILEITNEIKAKVFSQYLGQKIEIPKVKGSRNFWFCTPSSVLNIEVGLKDYEGTVLILRPLSAITEFQLLEIAKLYEPTAFNVSFNINSSELYFTFFIKEGIKQRAMIPIEDSSKTYQWFLQNGFDTKQLLLGWKTLNEAGLAIYNKNHE